MAITANRGRSQSKFSGYVEGGPELIAKLGELEEKVRKQYGKDALAKGGRVIADAWSEHAPIGQSPEDPHPGAYRKSLQQEDAVKSVGTKTGAIGSVKPGFVDGIASDDQPGVYAAKLEFTSDPSARPAFDASRDNATQAIADYLREVLQ